MKHGDKAKKTTKAKASIKKAIGKVAAKIKASTGSRKEASPKEASPKEASTKAKANANAKSSAAKPEAGGNGNGKGANPRNAGPVTFSNPVVGNAFKRAVKKYPTAFRRLTD